ncbi:MAG TPA: tyrosine-type recombinase/integrase [Dongiaceae bacterium]|nr:tyrosine-type recombinase/integrase [Dongiaceae bacterium]
MTMDADTKLNPELLCAFKREMLEHQLEALDQARDGEGAISPEQAKANALLAELSARFFQHDLAVNDNTIVNCFLAQEIERQNLRVAPGTPDWNMLARHGKQVMEQVCLADARRYRGDYNDTAAYRAIGLPGPSEIQVISAVRVSAQAKRPLLEVYAECKEHKIRKSEWKHSTVMSKDVSIRLFREAVGDLRFDLITADHAAEFDRALGELPAMVGKSVYAGLTVPEAIQYLKLLRTKIERDRDEGRITVDEANRLLAEARCQPMAPHTRNKHINALASVVTWARTVMKWGIEDHFAAFRLDRPGRRKQPKKRIALTRERLFDILQSPRFSGRKTASARGQTIAGDIVVKDGLYWAPLLESHNGCRLDEAAKLRTFDVVKLFGMWCLKLNFDGDRLGRGETEAGSGKTETSKRIIPMHRVLIQLGLPEQARGQDELYDKNGTKDQERWLFPELTVSKHHKTRSAHLTKRWATYLTTSGLYRKWEDGHALRHSFNDALIRAGVPEAVIRELMGHSQQISITTDTYFTASTLLQLKHELDKLDYGLPLETRDGAWQIARPAPNK